MSDVQSLITAAAILAFSGIGLFMYKNEGLTDEKVDEVIDIDNHVSKNDNIENNIYKNDNNNENDKSRKVRTRKTRKRGGGGTKRSAF
jgi:hypothetical protein